MQCTAVAVLPEESAALGRPYSSAFEKVQHEGGKVREGVVRADQSRAVTRVVEDGVVRRTLRLQLQDCLRMSTAIVQKKAEVR